MDNPMSAEQPAPQRFQEAATEDPEITAVGGTSQQHELVLEAMRDVIDPELGINVVDLGLLYGVNFTADNVLVLDMTLTSAACPLTDVIEDQTKMMLAGMADEVLINWVWLPPWGPDRIRADGRAQLRAIGFNV